MRHFSVKFFVLFQLCLYLLGGHATAHGLAWCISSEGHAHVATAAGCLSEAKELSCTTARICVSAPDETGRTAHSGVECRHLPVTAPHAASVASAEKVASASVVTIAPALFDPTLRCLTATACRQTPYPAALELPWTVALDSLRTIVLVI